LTPRSARQNAGAITDVPGIRVGHWTDRRAITGCTVVLPDRPCVAGVDVRGGAPGTRETDLLRPGNLVQRVHGVVLAGGSAYGLAAADGVMRYLAGRGAGFTFGGAVVPIVPAAILYDLGIGRDDRWPDADAGYRAAAAARATCAEGSVGAGAGATIGKALGPEHAMKGGIGTASETASNGVISGALAAVNASGNVIDPATGRTIAGPLERGYIADTTEVLRSGRAWRPEMPGANTVLVVVATNLVLTKEQANRLATICHDGLARAVRPAHTPGDGDIVFTLATGDLPMHDGDYRVLEAIATRAVERAIVRGATQATSLGGVPASSSLSSRRRRQATGPRRAVSAL
jgi:L-aminopeptidase/D-esterase-like protein